jgi:3-methyl-2-oxobutanoate hydroxymethyltransferase
MATPHAKKRLTVRDLRRMREAGERIVVLTAYDAFTARLADEAGVHLLLVGDSLGMTLLGYATTIPVTLEQSLHHTAAVVRGRRRALVIGDMPFLTYQISPDEALRNAARYLQEAGADGVKIEGGRAMAPTVTRLTETGIPVLGHIGILPQRVLAEGGYRVKGRGDEEARSLLDDAQALQEAGCFAIVLEGIPATLAAEITAQLTVPTIGIGAGPGCSGQVQVVNDVLGLFDEFQPKHAKAYARLGDEMRRAIAQYCREVRAGEFPDAEHSF